MNKIFFEDIYNFFKLKNFPEFRYKQYETNILKNFKTNFDEFTNFSKELREELKKKFKFPLELNLIEKIENKETVKFLFKTYDNQFIESVLIKHRDNRLTLCISSQIFCAVGCKFCATGANKFKRNLSYREIIEQAVYVNSFLSKKNCKITNIVFMGQGEPFLNYNNVVLAIKILNNNKFFNIGSKHIVVSTSGIIPRIYDLANSNLKVKLAISLHAPNNKLRDEIMPINKFYPLNELIKACDYYVEKTNKRVSYEYVLIKNVNDSIKCAKEIVNLLKSRLDFVNLLIYNPHEFSSFEKPDKKNVMLFYNYLKKEKISVAIRKSMGDDISSACGQLSSKKIIPKKIGFEKENILNLN